MNPDFSILKNIALSYFLQTVGSIVGDKLLMLDPHLRPFFRLMLSPVPKDFTKDTILLEQNCIIDIDTPVIIFALKSSPTKAKIVANLISELKTIKKLVVFMCPRYTPLCKQIFEETHIDKLITVYEFPYELIPVDTDVLTLDDNTSLADLMLNRNFTCLELVKDSINRLESLFGQIPMRYARGDWSCMVYDSLLFNRDIGLDYPQSQIDGLIILDRTLDLYTPFLTQMTYEGIIDEFYPIDCGTIRVEKKVIEPEKKEEGEMNVYLTGPEDILFQESRDKHFNIMKDYFPKKFEQMKSLCEKREEYKTLKEMTEYIARLRELKIPHLQKFFNIRTC